MLISNATATATATAAIAIPTGVASVDGGTYFITGDRGIDAIDAATGAVAWSTTKANLPVLALPGTLLAIRGTAVDDHAWSGSAALVAIDLTAPHAARAGASFALPGTEHRIADVHVDGGAVVAGWYATSPGGPMGQSPTLVTGTLRVDLSSGRAEIVERPVVPEAVRDATSSGSLWQLPWRTHGGWSALLVGGTATALTMTLRHWPDTGEVRSIELLAGVDMATTSVMHATAQHAFVHTCDRAQPSRCELRAYDAETGALARTLPDPLPEQLHPPFALVAERWLAVVQTAGSYRRELNVVSVDGAARSPWRHSILPQPPPDLRP
jgi:hypothetical protein